MIDMGLMSFFALKCNKLMIIFSFPNKNMLVCFKSFKNGVTQAYLNFSWSMIGIKEGKKQKTNKSYIF